MEGCATELTYPRWVAKLAARAGGYFWLPCEICSKEFAGFEWGETLIAELGRGTGTCARAECRVETKRRNREWLAQNPTAPSGMEWIREQYEKENAP